MRIDHSFKIAIWLWGTGVGSVPAQSISYTPGPANLDTARFAHVYFLRDTREDSLPYWFGVVINDDSGLCVKTVKGQIYRVNVLMKGETRFSSKIYGVKEEVTLNLQSGRNYYVELRPKKKGEKDIKVNFNVLDDASGLDRISSYPGVIQDRYCILPYLAGRHDFRENVWKDTIGWYASKHYRYLFVPLPSWEIILRSPVRTSLVFHNKTISSTYSETGGIVYQDLPKCRSEADFEQFCREGLLSEMLLKKRDSLISSEIVPISPAEGIQYARLVNVENTNIPDIKDEHRTLLIRTSEIVFFWTDEKGKGYTASLVVSERGLPEELHSLQELERRIKWVWQSFRLVNKDSSKTTCIGCEVE